MTRPLGLVPRPSRNGRFRPAHRCGYTLVEILTATVLMLIIMMAVTVIFASVTDSIGQSRANLEMSQRLRATATILKQDLEDATAVMNPPRHPRDNCGYFQYVEGPIGPLVRPSEVAWNTERAMPDTTVGDIDDMLLFTVTSKSQPYIGLIGGDPAISNSAEVIYFVRGRTLYRRVLLIRPETDVRETPPAGFYANNDLSVRKAWDEETVPPVSPPGPPYTAAVECRPVLAANSLADLTRPECRTFHQPDLRAWERDITGANATTRQQPTPVTSVGLTPKLQKNNSILRYRNEPRLFPFFLRPWLGAPYDADPANITENFKWVPGLGLPILAECSDPRWRAGDLPPSENLAGFRQNDSDWVQMLQFTQPIVPTAPYDAWTNEHPWSNVDPLTGVAKDYPNGTRIGDDVILTNVIGFDVKAWDPYAPILMRGTTNPGNPIVTLMPGDPGYISEVISVLKGSAFKTDVTVPMVATGAYVDLNYMAQVPYTVGDYPDSPVTHASGAILPAPLFYRQGYPLSADSDNVPLASNASLAYGTRWQLAVAQQPYCFFPSVYDTWSLHYEYNRQLIRFFSPNPADQNFSDVVVGDEDGIGGYDQAANGYDDNDANGVDDVGERETQPPYAVPLQGIQVRIRVFEPGSRQVREVTLVQKFRTK